MEYNVVRYLGKKDQKNIPALAPICAVCKNGLKKISVAFKKSSLAVLLRPYYRRACDIFHTLKKSRRGRAILILFAAFFITGGIFVLAELGGYGVNGPATAPNSLDYGLVGYWDMEEGNGQTLKDKSGNGDDGTLGANSSVGTDDPVFAGGHNSSGLAGTALDFDGNDDRVDAGGVDAINGLTSFSVSVWVKTDTLEGGEYGLRYITAKEGLGAANTAYILRLDTSVDLFEFYVAGADYVQAQATTPVVAGVWYHVIGVYDGGYVRIYVNGQEEKATAKTGVTGSTTEPVNIGHLIYNSASARHWDGSLDEMRIYNRALSADEARLLYNQKKPILQYKFDEGSGTTLYDESFNNNDATLVNSPVFTAGKSATALDLELTSSQYGYLADNVSVSLTKDLTLSAWIKPELATAATQFDIAGKWDGANESYLLSQYGDEVRVYIDSASNYKTTDAANLAVGTWYHIEAVYTAASQTVNIYVNGILQAGTVTGTIPTSIGNDTGRFQIGAEDSTTTAANFYDGIIDSFRLYNYARTADEVVSDYNDGQAARFGENNQDLNLGLVGYWDMEEGNGQTVQDRSVSGNDGTLGSSASADSSDPVFASGHNSSGANGTGLKFDGVNDYVNAGAGENTAITNNLTFAAWVKPLANNPVAGSPEYGISSIFCLKNANNGLMFADSKFRFRTNTGSDVYLDTVGTYSLDKFYFVAGTYDGTNMNIYIDGVNRGTIAQTGNLNLYNYIMIGEAEGDIRHFNGTIDEVRLYNRALSADEIRQLYNKKKPVMELHMDEESSGIILDESFNDNNAAPMGAISVTTGKFGNARDFESTSSNNAWGVDSTSLSITGDLTMSAWIKPESVTASTLFDIGGKWDGSTWESYLLAQYGDEIRVYIDSSSSYKTTDSTNLSVGNWYHVEAVYKASTQTVDIYINGVLQAGTVTGTIPASIEDDAGRFVLGAEDSVFTPNNFYDGVIDEFYLYSYARTSAEALVDYNGGVAANLGKNNQEINRGLIGYWDMEEGNGQTVGNKAAGVNNGTLGSSSSVDSADPDFVTGHDSSGAVGMGLGFDGGSDYVDVGTDSNLSLTSTGTISLWIKPNSLTQDDFAGFVTKRHNVTGGTAATYSYSFHWRSGDSVLRLAISDGATIIYATAPLFTDTNWHHVLGLWDGTNMKIYKDGVLAATPVAQTLNAQAGTGFNTVIGGASFSTSASNRGEFNGSIDEVRIYNRALSEDEIRMLYNQKKPILEMKLDEGAGGVAYDDTFNNTDGTLGGGTADYMPLWVQGKNGGSALSFGGNDYVDLGKPNNLQDLAYKAFTFSLWVKPAAANGIIISRSDANASKGWLLEMDAGHVRLMFPGSSNNGRLFSVDTLPLDQWTLLTVNYTGSGFPANAKIYFNGIQQSTTINAWTGGTVDDSAFNFYVGYDPLYGGDSGVKYFTGLIDSLRIYNYVRSDSEVLVDFNNGLAAHLR